MKGLLPRRLTATILATIVLLAIAPHAGAATQVGFKAHSFSGFSAETSGGAITGQKPESKLWYNAGSWWAAMLSPAAAGAHTIWRLDTGGWTDTGVVIDSRPSSKEDVLSIGNTLYITSRVATSLGGNSLRRFTYSGGSYTLDTGFPVTIAGEGAETLTIARDSLGILWITFEKGGSIFVARSGTSDTNWKPQFAIPVTGATGVDSDDISSIVSFTDATGPAVGVMWSNHNTDTDYFAVHRDGAADTTWTVETALTGPSEADDHINLKTFEGRVYAVVKTEQSDAGATLVWLLVRTTTGSWSKHHVARKDERNTRPITILNIDPSQRRVYVFMTIGEGSEARGISYKATSIDGIAFPSEPTVFIQGASNELINDATSMKQNTDQTTGIVILASDTVNYWWNRLGGTGTPGSPPTANPTSATTNEEQPVTITISGTDPDTCDLIFSTVNPPAHGSLGPITNLACAQGSPNSDSASLTYTPATDYAGSDSFTFIVSDGSTSSAAATVSLTVNGINDAPTAIGGTATTTQGVPVTVTMTGSDPESCELTFAISATPANGTLGTITNQACTAASPNTDRASVTYTPASGFTGTDTFNFTVKDGSLTSAAASMTVTVGAGATGISFRAATSGSNATATSLTLPAPAAQPGDVMLATVTVRGEPTITAPSGWTLVRMDVQGFVMRQAVYVKVFGSEPASYTWSFGMASEAAAGGIVAYAGVSQTNPINAHNGWISPDNKGTRIIAPAVKTTVNGAMLVALFGAATSNRITPAAELTERYDVSSTGGPFPITSSSADVLQPTAANTRNKTARTKGADVWTMGQLIALTPA